VWSVECGVWNVEGGMWKVEGGGCVEQFHRETQPTMLAIRKSRVDKTNATYLLASRLFYLTPVAIYNWCLLRKGCACESLFSRAAASISFLKGFEI